MEYILFFSLIFFIVIIFAISEERKWKNYPNLLPGPVRFPFIGSTFQAAWFMKTGSNSERLHKLCRKYGQTLGFQAGIQYFVVTENIQTAKEIMLSDVWNNRFPAHPLYSSVTSGENTGIALSYGPNSKEMRKFATRTLIEKGFGNLHTTDLYLSQELDCFLPEFDNFRKIYNDDIRIHEHFSICVFNVVWKFVANARFEYHDEQLQKILRSLECINGNIHVGSNPVFSLPFLRFIPGLTDVDVVNSSINLIYKLFRELIAERRVLGNFKHSQEDFIDEFLFKIDEEGSVKYSKYTDNQLIQCCTDILVGGIGSTSHLIEFTLLYLTKYPRIQERLKTEVDEIIGRKRAPSVLDKKRMPYAEALLLEILRNTNPFPMFPRASSVDTKLGDFNVPEQSLALINLAAIHQDKTLWGDPETFRPERFLDKNMQVLDKGNVITFGGGKRMCIAHTMAKLIWFKFITTLVQKYTFVQSPTNPELNTTPDSGFRNMPHPFNTIVKLRARKSEN